MKPASFTYSSPRTLPEALELLAANQGDCKILAGGQSLVPAMNFRLARPGMLIDINNIESLDYIHVDGAALRIGALTRHATFHRLVADNPLGRMLSRVVQHIAHYPIRQRGTFAGSLCHADPASEWCLVTTTMGADLVAKSSAGERVIPAAGFFKGTFVTALKEDEILVEIRFPSMPEGWKTGFYEFSRRAGDFALAMSLVALKLEGGRITDARVGLGGVADKALRLDELEAMLVGQSPSEDLFERVSARATELVEPPADIHGSSEYRRHLVATVLRRALDEAVA